MTNANENLRNLIQEYAYPLLLKIFLSDSEYITLSEVEYCSGMLYFLNAKEDKINLNTIYSNFRDMFIITISRPFKIPFKSETLEEMFPKTVEDLLNYYEKNIFKENCMKISWDI